MKIATWNVNGIRARQAQLREWLERDRPDVVCLQELKAEAAQVPEQVKFQDYHAYWHGLRAYSGVSLHIRKGLFDAEPAFSHPEFDMESRIVQAEVGRLVLASVYVPNGGKDYEAKLGFMIKPSMSVSWRTTNSSSSISTSVPAYFANSTCCPTSTFIGTGLPSSVRR